MYICVCNALTEQQVRSAISQNCTSALDIYHACGVEPQCGKCMELMWDMLKTENAQPLMKPPPA